MGTGVKAFFHEPYKSLQEGGTADDFMDGVTKGTNDLVTNSAVALFGSASKITTSLSKGVELLMEDEYVQNRTRTAQKARNAGEGFSLGIQNFGQGLFDGATGIIVC